MLKKIFIIILSSLSFASAVAQNKIGFIDLDSVISSMPETITANLILKNFQDSLLHEYDRLQHSADSITNSFISDIDYMQAVPRIINRDSIIKIIERIQNFNEYAQDLAKQKANKMFAPIKEKALVAIRKVAQENNYTYILAIDSVKFNYPTDNIFPLVIKALGIKEDSADQEY